MLLHDVTVQDVMDVLPMPAGAVTETSAGLNTVMLEKWIRTSAGILNALLERNGINPAQLNSNATELIRDGIISYSASMALRAREYDEGAVNAFQSAWQETRRTVREMSADLGDSDQAASVQSNITPGRNPWGKDFGGW